MGTEVKNQSKRLKFGLIICVVLLFISSLWLVNTNQSLQDVISANKMENSDLQKQIGTLQTQNANLQNEISDLNSNLQSQISQVSDLEGQVSDLEGQVGDLQNQISNLKAQNSGLKSQVDSLQTQNNDLQNEMEELIAPQLHEVDVKWADHERYSSPYVSIQGSIFNSGTDPAQNAILTVRLYDSVGTLLKSEEIHLGKVEGKTYIAFIVDITYSGDTESVITNLTHD